MTAVIALIPLVLLAGAALLGFLALRRAGGAAVPDRAASLIAAGASGLAFLLAAVACLGRNGVVEARLFSWIHAASFAVDFAFRLDEISVVMILVVTFVGTLIHVFSTGYMKGDPGYVRYMAYLNLFMFFMTVLVLARNLPVLFVGWEGVGLCSYLLIGFWWKDTDKALAGKKAFITNRVGDAAFILGMLFLASRAGTLDLPTLARLAVEDPAIFTAGSGILGFSVATLAGLLLFIGATGKSAQLPLHVWLPDAMAGPTPVSALIHAATMVTAGVYMIARLHAIFALSPSAQIVVALVGALTAVFAASIALVQTDIKKVLAWSTISQLGYMVTAVGLGAVSAGLFHLTTHAFFKACLFLGAGSIIHAMHHEQDMRRMGGLAGKMPVTFWTMLIATLAMTGVPPLSGFFSKDEILLAAFTRGHGVGLLLFGALAFGAFLTGFYMMRFVFLVFAGRCRADHHTAAHIHESPRSMTSVLVVLAAGAALLGFLGVPHFLGGHDRFGAFVARALAPGAAGHAVPPVVEMALAAVATLVAFAGMATAWVFYILKPSRPAEFAARHAGFTSVLERKYGFDEAYSRAVARPIERLGAGFLGTSVESRGIDRAANGLAALCASLGRAVVRPHGGLVRLYVAVMAAGALLVILSLMAG